MKKKKMLNVDYLKLKYFVNLKEDWLNDCINFLSNNQAGYSSFNFEKKADCVFAQILESDLREIAASNIPEIFKENLSEKKWILKGSFLLQCNFYVNIAKSSNNRENANKSMLKLQLSDGVMDLFAIESQLILGFQKNLPMGVKILIKDCLVRRGLLILTPNNCKIVGGKIEWMENERLKNKNKESWEIMIDKLNLSSNNNQMRNQLLDTNIDEENNISAIQDHNPNSNSVPPTSINPPIKIMNLPPQKKASPTTFFAKKNATAPKFINPIKKNTTTDTATKNSTFLAIKNNSSNLNNTNITNLSSNPNLIKVPPSSPKFFPIKNTISKTPIQPPHLTHFNKANGPSNHTDQSNNIIPTKNSFIIQKLINTNKAVNNNGLSLSNNDDKNTTENNNYFQPKIKPEEKIDLEDLVPISNSLPLVNIKQEGVSSKRSLDNAVKIPKPPNTKKKKHFMGEDEDDLNNVESQNDFF